MNINQEKKLRLLRIYPNAVVYKFNNTILRDVSKSLTILELAGSVIKQYWGFGIDDSDVEYYEKRIDEVVEIAEAIIGQANALASYSRFDYNELLTMSIEEKEKKVREENLIEILIPSNDKMEFIFRTLIYIDQYDLLVKQYYEFDEVEKWINLVSKFIKTVNGIKEEGIKIVASKIPLKKLAGKYKPLKKIIKDRN